MENCTPSELVLLITLFVQNSIHMKRLDDTRQQYSLENCLLWYCRNDEVICRWGRRCKRVGTTEKCHSREAHISQTILTPSTIYIVNVYCATACATVSIVRGWGSPQQTTDTSTTTVSNTPPNQPGPKTVQTKLRRIFGGC